MGEQLEAEPAADAKQRQDMQLAVGEQLKNFKPNYLDRSDIRPSKKRYLILLLFCLHSGINSLQWIYLSSITSSVAAFYQVDNFAINLTSTIYMLVYIPLVVPSTWLIERLGLRNAILLGSLGTSLGSLLKCFSCERGQFWRLLMSGQTLVAASQLFILSVPPRLASVWFPDHQVSLANACGVFGNQLGIALGFVVPQLVIGEPTGAEASERIGSGLWTLFVGVALVSAAITLLIALLFDEMPARPPGLARLQQMIQESAAAELGAQPLVLAAAADQQQQQQQQVSPQRQPQVAGGSGRELARRFGFGALLWDLATDRNFVLLMLSYGLNVGVFYAISTVLNQMIAPSWQQANALVGRLGLLLVLAGMLGSVVAGFVLDRTRLYRLVNACLYAFSLLALLLFAATLELHNLAALHVSVLLLGYFMTGYLFIGYEMSNEITWPRPESVTAGLLNLSAQVFGVLLTYSGSAIVDNHGSLAANAFFAAWLALGLAISLMIKAQLKRQSAMDT